MRYWAVALGLVLAACGAQNEHVSESGGEAGEGIAPVAGAAPVGGSGGNVNMAGTGGTAGKGGTGGSAGKGGAGAGGAAGSAGTAGTTADAGSSGTSGSSGSAGAAGATGGAGSGGDGGTAGSAGSGGTSGTAGASGGTGGMGGAGTGGEASAGAGGMTEPGPYSLGCREEPPFQATPGCSASRPHVWYCTQGTLEAAVCEPASNGPEPPATLSCCALECVADPSFDYGTASNLACPASKPVYRFCVGNAAADAVGCTPGGPSSSAGGWCCDS
jgi:hypothetical protein